MSTLVQQNRKELSALLIHHKSDGMKKHIKTDHKHNNNLFPSCEARKFLQLGTLDCNHGRGIAPEIN